MVPVSSGVLLENVSYEPPEATEVEVSIFGPGFGECVVVHLGMGEWMVVDSCIGPTRMPAAVEYLNTLKVDIADAVSIIVASHWHDDHVRGISTVLEKASRAKFVASGAFNAPEFLAVANRSDLVSRFSSGVEELSRVRTIADDRRSAGGPAVNYVSAVNRIRHVAGAAVSAVWALSPSDEDKSRSIDHIASLLQPPSGGIARVPSMSPNDTSVVLQLETVAGDILLGADLEHFPSVRTRGWHAIVDHGGRPNCAARIFKIPHHGSRNADCPEVWEHMIQKLPISVVTPFERGKVPLPRPEDRVRVRTNSQNAFITSDKKNAPVRRDPATLKTIKEGTRLYRPELLVMGHVQLRSSGQEWVVRGSEPAAAL